MTTTRRILVSALACLPALLLAGCGAEVAGTAATTAALQAQQIKQARQQQQQFKAQFDEALKAVDASASAAGRE